MTQVGNVYGEALYTLAREEGLAQAILRELTVLEHTAEEENSLNVCKSR